MVKGISRQVIVVQSPKQEIFEQAIFILKENALGENGVTDDVLLEEAHKLINAPKSKSQWLSGLIWAFGGAVLTGVTWLLTVLL